MTKHIDSDRKRLLQILEELKDDDYDNYCHTGRSLLSEDQWDALIERVKKWKENRL